MYPEYQNVPPPAPVARPAYRLSMKSLLIIGGIIIAVLLSVVLLIASSQNTPLSQMQRLSARFVALQALTEEGDNHTSSGALRKVHSDASILITSNTQSINAAMSSAGLGTVPKEITAAETDQATLDTLKDAELNGRFDDAYRKALSHKLENTMALMQEIHGETRSQELKSALTTGYEHFGTLLDQLAKL